MKLKFIFCYIFYLAVTSALSKVSAQCTWHTLLSDGYEYTTPCPDIIPGSTYTAIPQSYAVHGGSYSLYMNFVDCVGSTGTCPGDTVYVRHIPVCPGVPVRFSAWFTTTFSGAQCSIDIRILDTLNIVLSSTAALAASYSPTWTQYTSPVVYPLTSTLSFVLITNVGGGNGNDLSMDDFLVENCYDVPVGPDTVLCKNQSVSLVTDTTYAAYLWSNGSTDKSPVASYGGPGTDTSYYFVTVTNSYGCQLNSDTAQIIFTDCGGVNFASSDSSFCEKHCIDFFDLSGTAPTSWQWTFTGGSPNSSTMQNPTGICYQNYGHFDVTLIACAGIDCDTLTITSFINEYPNPTDSIYQSNDTLYSLPAYGYQWYTTSGIIAGATMQYYVITTPGSYYCITKDTIGCVATSNTLVVAGIFNPQSSSGGFLIYPNPNNGTFDILSDQSTLSTLGVKGNIHCVLTDATGRVILKTELNQPVMHLNTNVADGIYFLEIGNEKKLIRAKLIVSK